MISLTIILPTYNEKSNLEILLPEILSTSWPVDIKVLVVDDNSKDGTNAYVDSVSSLDKRVQIQVRESAPSLPLSIWDGVKSSKSDFVAWLDADCSMPINDLLNLVCTCIDQKLDGVVGSRFCEGGGFKGLNLVGKTSLPQFYRNVRTSKDSIVAILLSRLLNVFLRLVLRAGVKDMTSGFFVVRKSFIEEKDFVASYGDYCPVLIRRLSRRGAKLKEVGYICIPRMYGESKTGSTIMQYLLRGFPYIWRSLIEILPLRSR